MSKDDTEIRFIKAFANVPAAVRVSDIIVVVDGKPFTWESAFFEIKNNTAVGKMILIKIEEAGLI